MRKLNHPHFHCYIILAAIFLAPTLLSAQVRVVVQELKCYSDRQRECEQISTYIINTLRSDDRLQLVGTTEANAVQTEIELQKEEDFLEGQVVDALFSPDTDWLITSHYSARSKTLTTRIFDSETKSQIDEESVTIELGLLVIISDRQAELVYSIRRLLARQFTTHISVVKTLNASKTKVREILIAGGTHHGLQNGQRLLIKPANGALVAPDAPVISELEVIAVENENFSRCLVIRGGKALFTALAEGQSLKVVLP